MNPCQDYEEIIGRLKLEIKDLKEDQREHNNLISKINFALSGIDIIPKQFKDDDAFGKLMFFVTYYLYEKEAKLKREKEFLRNKDEF